MPDFPIVTKMKTAKGDRERTDKTHLYNDEAASGVKQREDNSIVSLRLCSILRWLEEVIRGVAGKHPAPLRLFVDICVPASQPLPPQIKLMKGYVFQILEIENIDTKARTRTYFRATR